MSRDTPTPEQKPRLNVQVSGPNSLRPGAKRRRLTGAFVAILLSAIAVVAAARFERKPPPAPTTSNTVAVSGSAISITTGAPQWDVIRLGKAEPATEHWSDPVPGYVRVDETRAARVGAPLGGRVQKVYAELGQVVSVGTPLFSVASPDLAALRADLEHAKIDRAAAKTTFDRVHAIVQARALPEKEEVQAGQTLSQAELAETAAASRLSSLKVATQGYGEFVVKSPRAGQVAEKSVLPGQEIDAGAQGNLMMIADLSSVWVVAELFESDTIGVHPGTKTHVTVASAPGRVFDAEVETVSAVVDPDRHSIPIRVRLENPDGVLKPNTFARMQFYTSAPSGSVDIPSSALVTDGSNQYVYTRSPEGKFARKRVTAGAAREGRVIVTEGLAAGDIVVERGAILLDNQIQLAD
ncbi:MAG TPA: efflux RND transporter periplasmic adaptor subunit [Polyangiaceae bacterium]|jgi:RND family efflux transporter MFP subunit|nr:efflux RND transporter periplasmic adaptor subunit [Polyangiaceae bacterium]